MADPPLVAYLRQVHVTYASGGGTKERSYYSALSVLFNGVGKRLKPRVHFVHDLADAGADFPDFGLFVDDQLTPDGGLKATVAVPDRVGGGPLDPEAGDLAVTARWGYLGHVGQTMPGPGETVARPFSEAERTALGEAAEALAFQAVARRIAALLLLDPELDAAYAEARA